MLTTTTVTITPNGGFTPGSAHQILTSIKAGTIMEAPDGTLSANLTAEQIALFRMKGPMHKIVVSEPPATTAPTATAINTLHEQWQQATGVHTPDEAKARIVSLTSAGNTASAQGNAQVTAFRNASAQLQAQVASLTALDKKWQEATGMASPEAFTASKINAAK